MKGIYINKRKRTRRQLIHNTLKLAQKTDLEHITISAIIKETKVNRSTFYRHFQDKWDLIEQVENELLNKMQNYFSKYLKNNDFTSEKNRNHYLYNLISFINDNHDIFIILINDNGDIKFRNSIKLVILKMIQSSINSEMNVSNKDLKLLSNYLSSAILGTIQMWGRNYNEYSIDEIYNFLKYVITRFITHSYK